MFCRRRDQTKQTLAVTLLFQCNFLLVVGADNLIWQFYFYFYRILSKWCWINTKVFIGFSIPSACTQTFPGIRRVNFILEEWAVIYADKVWRRTINFLDIKRCSWIHIRKISSDPIQIMLEKTMYLAIMLLLVQYRFQNHWSDGKHNAKVWTVN